MYSFANKAPIFNHLDGTAECRSRRDTTWPAKAGHKYLSITAGTTLPPSEGLHRGRLKVRTEGQRRASLCRNLVTRVSAVSDSHPADCECQFSLRRALTGVNRYRLLIAVPLIGLCACNKPQTTQTASTSGATTTLSPSSYTPRIGVAVSTATRTCMAIHNGNLTNGAAVTLISPTAPPSYVPGTVSGIAQQPCPITQTVDTTVSNYSIDVQGPIPKLTPLIAVLGTPVVTTNANNVPQADVDQTGHPVSFRACSADNGIHLTVWSGDPLKGTMLWHGFYYEAGNPGTAPPCAPGEMPAG